MPGKTHTYVLFCFLFYIIHLWTVIIQYKYNGIWDLRSDYKSMQDFFWPNFLTQFSWWFTPQYLHLYWTRKRMLASKAEIVPEELRTRRTSVHARDIELVRMAHQLGLFQAQGVIQGGGHKCQMALRQHLLCAPRCAQIAPDRSLSGSIILPSLGIKARLSILHTRPLPLCPVRAGKLQPAKLPAPMSEKMSIKRRSACTASGCSSTVYGWLRKLGTLFLSGGVLSFLLVPRSGRDLASRTSQR
ncbi:hypothetical protein FB451DRAFT_119215 [Mycena latifolia]|nr:hypothetical protein FB451DRAFT_119215 [Mycena latifolia]